MLGVLSEPPAPTDWPAPPACRCAALWLMPCLSLLADVPPLDPSYVGLLGPLHTRDPARGARALTKVARGVGYRWSCSLVGPLASRQHRVRGPTARKGLPRGSRTDFGWGPLSRPHGYLGWAVVKGAAAECGAPRSGVRERWALAWLSEGLCQPIRDIPAAGVHRAVAIARSAWLRRLLAGTQA